MKSYFEKPVQVKFYNPEDGRWLGGIAIRESVICCECGQELSIYDIFRKEKPNEPDPEDRIIELKWISISDEILGDEA
jgi:hypothetical protein